MLETSFIINGIKFEKGTCLYLRKFFILKIKIAPFGMITLGKV